MTAKLRFIYSDYTIHTSDEPVFYNPDDYDTVKFVLDNYALIRTEADD